MQAAARARSSAMALRGLNCFLCAEAYLRTALAMSVRHDALERMAVLSSNSATNASSTSSSSGRIVLPVIANYTTARQMLCPILDTNN
jgi:hypothetical protein